MSVRPVLVLAFAARLTIAQGEGSPGPAYTFEREPNPVARNAAGVIERVFLARPDAKIPEATRTALSPDASRVAVGHKKGLVHVFDAAAGSLIAEFTLADARERWAGTPAESFMNGWGGKVTGLAFLDGGRRLLVAVAGGRVARCSIEARVVEAEHVLPTTVAQLDVDEARGRFVIGTGRGGVIEHDLASFEPRRTFRAEDDSESAGFVRYVAEGRSLLSALDNYQPMDDVETEVPKRRRSLRDAGLTRWSTATGERERRFGAPSGYAVAVEAAPDSIVASSDQGHVFEFRDDGKRELDVGHGALATVNAGGERHLVSVWADKIRVMRCSEWGISVVGSEARDLRVEPHSLCAAPKTASFALGLRDGGVAVYRFAPLDAAARSAPRTQSLGEAFGVSFEVALELRGHLAEVQEIVVSPGGAFLASRDAKGQTRVWQRKGDAWTGKALPFDMGSWNGCARMSVRAADESLLLVLPDGKLRRISLATGEAHAPLAVTTDGAKTLEAQVALDLDASSTLVGTADGGLVVIDSASGVVLRTVVPPGGRRPYWRLAAIPQRPLVVAAPHEVPSGAGPEENRLIVFRPGDGAVLAKSDLAVGKPQVCILGQGAQVIVASDWGDKGLHVLTTALERVAWNRRCPDEGLVAIGDRLILGAFEVALAVYRVQDRQIEETKLAPGMRGVSCLGAHSEATSAWLGMESGAILEVRTH